MRASAAATVGRAFVTVSGRQVHYRRAGSGPPVALVHESPRSSLSLTWLIDALAERFCVIALDTPGYGGSDALDADSPSVEQYAEATVETLDALGLERFGLYGIHTGAAIALEVVHGWPQRVAGLVLDGLALYTDAERADRLANYAPPLVARVDGTHVLEAWSRYRDHFVFYPWYRREAAARRRIAMPSAQQLHDGVMDVFRAGAGYGKGYAAVFRYRPEPALQELSVPTLLGYRQDDVLASHAQRVPQLPACASIEALGPRNDGAPSRIGSFLSECALDALTPAAPRPARAPGSITRDYADTPWGQLLVRHAGEDRAPPLVMLHASPGSAEMLVELIEHLADLGRRVIALDTLGNGDSDKPPWQVAEIADYAPVVLAALESLGEPRFDLYGTHTGAHIAVEVALSAPDRVRRVVLDGVAMYEPDYVSYLLDNYTPALVPREDGSHLIWAWSFLRDQTLFWPWFNRTAEGVRSVEPIGPEQLHRWYVELLKSGHTYPIGYRAAFRHRLATRLPALQPPALLIATAADMLHATTLSAAELVPDARALTVSEDKRIAARTIVDFLKRG